MNVAFLGAGAWGTALAVQAAARHAVLLWAREPAQVQALAATRDGSGLSGATAFNGASVSSWNFLLWGVSSGPCSTGM